MKTNTYLNFPGQTEEAFEFYARAFGTKPESLTRFSDMPMDGVKLSAEDGRKIMHVSLPIGDGCVLMGSDTLEAFGHKTTIGNNTYTSIQTDSREQADAIFAALSPGGRVEMAPSDMPWGSYWGAWRDKFGVQWMVNFAKTD